MYAHARIQEFSSEGGGGGGGGPGQSDKKSSDVFCFFLSSAYFTEVKWSLSKKSIIFQGSGGGPTFSRVVQLFPGGSNCLFPIETHITCDFPGGGVQTPCPPPLDPHLMRTLKGDREGKWGWG